MKKMRTLCLVSASLLALAACSEKTAAPQGDAAPVEASIVDDADYAAAVADPMRFEEDRARDVARKPSETLAFFGIKSGDVVFEVEAGGGYFTDLYSLAVGPEGSVVMQDFQGFADYAADEIAKRLADDRLANVRLSVSMHDDLDAEDNSIDVATWVQGPHELYFRPEGGDEGNGDPAGSFAEIYRIVKPGGVFGVIDHAAASGAPETVGNDLHRIDKARVIALATGAGFVLETESDFLANPDDDHSLAAFAEVIRGKTDQFALKFRKPE